MLMQKNNKADSLGDNIQSANNNSHIKRVQEESKEHLSLPQEHLFMSADISADNGQMVRKCHFVLYGIFVF